MENENTVHLKECVKCRVGYEKEIRDLHFQLNEIALKRAESERVIKDGGMDEWRLTVGDQQKAFALMLSEMRGTFANKDQMDAINERQKTFATSKEVSTLTKFMYIGIGGIGVLQFVIGILLAIFLRKGG